MKSIVFPFYVKLAFILIILIAGGYIFILGERVLVPLLFSFLFAILLLPLANFLENKVNLPRGAASILSVLIFLSAASFIIYLLGSQIASLSHEWPLLKVQMANLFHSIQQWLQTTFHVNLERQTAYINNTTQKILSSSATLIETTVLSLSSIFLLLIFILIYTFFLLFYRRLLMRFIVAAFTEAYISIIYDISERIKHIVRKYITGLFLEMTIVTLIGCTIFWILGIKYMFLLALLVGIFNVIPYVGIFTALLISVSITFATSDGRHALLIAVSIICIHLFDSNFLMPKIVGSQVKVNPLIVILGVVIGEMLWGIPGMFLSIPYIAMAKVIFDRIEGLQPWGILLGEEEHTPKKVKNIIQKLRTKERQNA